MLFESVFHPDLRGELQEGNHPAGGNPMVRFNNVVKLYEGNPALNEVSFSVERGEMAFVTGPSGSGKTTILRLIYLADWPDSGSISVDGVGTTDVSESRIPYIRRKIGVVFQDFRLLNRTIFENVALALRIRGISEVKAPVNETLKMVGLRHKADSYPTALSGGEQQRAAIARAIIGDPTVLLADEPTGNLDPDTAAGILQIFKDVNAKGTTVLIATHNRDLYMNSGRRVFRLSEGGIVPEGGYDNIRP